MRRLGGWLLVGFGLSLLVAGAAAAVLVGPDDSVTSGSRRLESSGAAIVTGPGAIEYAGPTVTLDFTSQNGPVFVGVGSEVDVADLVSGVTHTQIDEIDLPSDLRDSSVGGAEDFLTAGPDLDWWIESATGEQVEVEFVLPDKPASVLVMNADGASSVSVDVRGALSVPGVFWGAIAVAVIGVGLLILGILTLRRGRSRRTTQAPAPSEAP